MRAVRVLITAASLASIGGVQVCVRELAAWLLSQGHTPLVYGPDHGRAAAQLARLTIPVTDDLATLGAPPDVIHGNSSVETATALLHFPRTPAIYVCHAWRGDLDAPRFPRVLRYLAVDDTCADRLLYREGIAAEKVEVVLNAADLDRFPPREHPLPPKPRRALIFGNAAHAASHASVIQKACARAGIDVDVAGELSGRALDEPERILRDYDLIFAKAKCAIEGMASGAAVVVCDVAGVAGMVTSGNVARLRRLNFGIRSLDRPVTLETIAEEIAAYDAADAARVAALIRETASTAALHERLLALYETVIAEFEAGAGKASWEEESRAAAQYLRYAHTATKSSLSNLNVVVQAAHRVMSAPVVGPALTRVSRWLTRRGRT